MPTPNYPPIIRLELQLQEEKKLQAEWERNEANLTYVQSSGTEPIAQSPAGPRHGCRLNRRSAPPVADAA